MSSTMGDTLAAITGGSDDIDAGLGSEADRARTIADAIGD
jgi:hypothetical protein